MQLFLNIGSRWKKVRRTDNDMYFLNKTNDIKNVGMVLKSFSSGAVPVFR